MKAPRTASPSSALAFISPMLVSRGPLPHGPGWAYEVKWDGIRGQAAVVDGRVNVRSRPGRDCTKSFPDLVKAPPALAGRAVVLDGEIVCLDRDGHPDFAAVRSRLSGRRPDTDGCLAFMAFDLLCLDDEPTMHLPYRARRELLEGLRLDGPTWRTPTSFSDADSLLRATREQGLEGVVAKHLDSAYAPGRRSCAWIKHKHLRSERLTVIGHAPTGSRGRRLLVADSRAGELRYRGVVELGLAREELWEALAALEQPGCPLAWGRPPGGVTWVSPGLEVEVSCHGRGGALREATVRAVYLERQNERAD